MESLFLDPLVPKFGTTGLMVPPWAKYPSSPRASVCWRMGEGEGYWDDFRAWWEVQPAAIQVAVRAAYPEPPGWVGFYECV